MALDGIVISSLVKEFNETLTGGKIAKIAQPENDELLLTIKNFRNQYRLLISAGASLPLIYLTGDNKPSPMTAPNFCMLLRKHIANGKILRIWQPGLERIIHFEIEHLNDLGDLCHKVLTVEIMGKHSNIIFCDDNNKIIDSIKHVGIQMSSVREVLPGREYFILTPRIRKIPHHHRGTLPGDSSHETASSFQGPLYDAYRHQPSDRRGDLSPGFLESDQSANSFSDTEATHLYHTFSRLMEDVKNGNFTPTVVYDGREPGIFSPSADALSGQARGNLREYLCGTGKLLRDEEHHYPDPAAFFRSSAYCKHRS